MTNSDLGRALGVSDDWIRERTGIRTRRVLEAGRAASDLAAAAGVAACRAAGLDPGNLDGVIVATVSGDHPFPATAALVERKMGIRNNAPAFDVGASCGGFIYALSVADALIGRGPYQNLLVIGADVVARMVDRSDPRTSVLFGDGAGAVVLASSAEPGRGLLSSHLYADGEHADLLCVVAGGSRHPASAATVAEKQHYVRMAGREIFRQAVQKMVAAAAAALSHNHLSPEDVDCVIVHQGNLRIIEAVADRLHIPRERFFTNIDQYGNTASASIPIALEEAVASGTVRSGSRVLLAAMGAGLVWAAALLVW